MPGDPYHLVDADAARLAEQRSSLGSPSAGSTYRGGPSVTSGVPGGMGLGGLSGGGFGFSGGTGALPGGAIPGGNPFSTRSDPVLMQRSRAAYAAMAREAVAGVVSSAGAAAEPPPVFDHSLYVGPPPARGGSGFQRLSSPSQGFQSAPMQPREASPMTPRGRDSQRASPRPALPPGGGFTVTTGGDPRMHSPDPLQFRMKALAASASMHSQQQQAAQDAAAARSAMVSPAVSLHGDSSGGQYGGGGDASMQQTYSHWDHTP